MKGVQSKISKLTLAFRQKGRILKINSEQIYSLKFDKLFTKYTVKETTVEEMKLRKVYFKKKEELKSDKNNITLRDEVMELKEKTDELYIPPKEFRNKLDIMLYLSERYKEVAGNG